MHTEIPVLKGLRAHEFADRDALKPQSRQRNRCMRCKEIYTCSTSLVPGRLLAELL